MNVITYNKYWISTRPQKLATRWDIFIELCKEDTSIQTYKGANSCFIITEFQSIQETLLWNSIDIMLTYLALSSGMRQCRSFIVHL